MYSIILIVRYSVQSAVSVRLKYLHGVPVNGPEEVIAAEREAVAIAATAMDAPIISVCVTYTAYIGRGRGRVGTVTCAGRVNRRGTKVRLL